MKKRRERAAQRPQQHWQYLKQDTKCSTIPARDKEKEEQRNRIRRRSEDLRRLASKVCPSLVCPGSAFNRDWYWILLIYSRSPRWTRGSPRMLLVLIREFESRRGQILNLFAKKKKKDQLLRAPSVGKKHNSTRVDEGRKSWNLLAINLQGTNRSA